MRGLQRFFRVPRNVTECSEKRCCRKFAPGSILDYAERSSGWLLFFSGFAVMQRFSLPTFVFSVALAISQAGGWSGTAQADTQLLGPVETRQLGLEEVWRRNLSVPAGRQSIIDQKMVVHQTMSHLFVEVIEKSAQGAEPAEAVSADDAAAEEPVIDENATVYARIAVDMDLEKRGAVDEDEANRLGRLEILRLKRRGIEAELRTRKVPMIRFYTLSNDGTVECRDAESGELIWLQRVGGAGRTYGGLGVDETYVTVVNGGELIKLDVANGQEFGVTKLDYVPTGGAMHCNGYAVVPSVGSRIVCYDLNNSIPPPFAEIVAGGTLKMPAHLADANKVAWGTDRGFVYLMELEGEPNVQFRLNTDGIVSGTPAVASGERFFFGSESGQIYGLKATRTGEVLWSRPTGEPIYNSPIFYDEKVLYPTAYGNLMCVSAEDGYSVWPNMVPGVQELLGGIDGKIYARSMAGSLIVVAAEDGKLLGRFPNIQPDSLVVNRSTNRLYLVNERGTMQCLRRPGAVLPKVIQSSAPPEKDEEEAELEKQEPEKTDGGTGTPFDPGGNPFGGDGNDPFGGDMADPFAPAGGADPFGDSPF